MKGRLSILFLIFIPIFFYSLTLRGYSGNLNTEKAMIDYTNGRIGEIALGPFESSHETSPYVFMLSMLQNHTISLPKGFADFGVPDIGYHNSKFYSFFPPGVPIIIMPLYIIGSYFNLGQLISYLTIPLLAVGILILLYLISFQIFGVSKALALIPPLVFAFGSTSWSYAITIYQHIPSVFLMLFSYYLVWRYSRGSPYGPYLAVLIWFCYGISIFFDYPNAFLLAPVILYFFIISFRLQPTGNQHTFSFRPVFLYSSIIFIIIFGSLFYYNYKVFGDWKQLHNTLSMYTGDNLQTLQNNERMAPVLAPDKIRRLMIFKENNLLLGIRVLLFSKERGLLYYSPIYILCLLGLYLGRKKMNIHTMTIVGLILMNLVLYASQTDTLGGRAFGPRYIIPMMAALSLFVPYIFTNTRTLFYKIIFLVFYIFSSAIALGGALTSNMLRKADESISLGLPYDYGYNFNLLVQNKSGSFIYNNFFIDDISLVHYFFVIYGLLLVTVIFVLFILPRYEECDTADTEILGDTGDSPQ